MYIVIVTLPEKSKIYILVEMSTGKYVMQFNIFIGNRFCENFIWKYINSDFGKVSYYSIMEFLL